jgi:hypothetical protein
LCQRFEIGAVAVVPGRHVAALLVVAEPGVDHDAVRGSFDRQRVDRHFQPALFGRKMRDQPGQFADFVVARERQDEARRADGFKLDDLGDFDLADLPVHRCVSCWLF